MKALKNLKSYTFAIGRNDVRIFAVDVEAARIILASLHNRNYWPTSGKVQQTSVDFDYKVLD